MRPRFLRRSTFEQLENRCLLTTLVEVRVNSPTDDAEERADGNVRLSSSDLELVFDKSDQTVGMRFDELNVPHGANITHAYIQFQVDESSSQATSLTIEGQAADNALTFLDSKGNLSSRPRTNASVGWSPAPWEKRGEAGPDQRTPDVSSIIEEIVNRPSWTSGNSLVVLITGSGERVAESYDGDSSGAPLLHIEYETDDPPPPDDSPNENSPPAVADQSFQVGENSPQGAVVGTVVASDPDEGQNLSYTITTGNTGNAFAIDASSGQITVANSEAIDLEATPSFQLTVQVTDDGAPMLSDSATITIHVRAENVPPATIFVKGGGAAAIQAALDSAAPGDIIEIAAGNYDDARPIEVTTSGAASKPITLRAAPGARPILPLLEFTDAKHWRLKGFEISNHPGETGIEVFGLGSENLIFEDLVLHHLSTGIKLRDGADFVVRDSVMYELTNGAGSDATGVSVFKAKRIEVRNNEIYDVTGDAIHLNDGSDDIYVNRELILVVGNHIYVGRADYRGRTENAIDVKGEYGGTVIFSNNIVHGFDESDPEPGEGPYASGGSDGAAINMNSKLDSGGSHLIVTGNLIYDGNVAVDTDLWSAEIYNNVFYDLGKRALTVKSDKSVEIHHNTFVSMPEAVDGPFADWAMLSNNLFYNAGKVDHATTNNAFFGDSYSTKPPGANPVTGNGPADAPGLVDPKNLNFHLRGVSPLIDAGADLGIRADMTGAMRDGIPDIGALEYLETAAILVSNISGDTTESGGSATFSVALSSQPTANVTIEVSSSDTGEGTVSLSSLTFTPSNWDRAQIVTVTGVDDDLPDGDVAYTIVTAAAISSDDNYNGLDPADVTVINRDHDQAGITVTPTSVLMTSEEGGKATLDVVLDSQPTADVTIGISSSDTSEGTVSVSSLTFTPSNWHTAQGVAVTGVDDMIDDGDVAYSIVMAPISSGDANYNGLNAADVTVTNSDNDQAGITVTPTSGLVTTETGDKATFNVSLDSQPTADVIIGISSTDTSEGAVSLSSLTFTPSNWNKAQSVTVTGVDDSEADGDVAYTIVTAAASSGDAKYDGLNAANVSATNTDNESPTEEPGGMYVWDIVVETRSRGKKGAFSDLRLNAIVHRDSDGDGMAESSDETVDKASITIVLNGPLSGAYSGTTSSDGKFSTDWIKNVSDGYYLVEVTDLSHQTYAWSETFVPTANDADADGLPDQGVTIGGEDALLAPSSGEDISNEDEPAESASSTGTPMSSVALAAEDATAEEEKESDLHSWEGANTDSEPLPAEALDELMADFDGLADLLRGLFKWSM